jgi:hypothetical protein
MKKLVSVNSEMKTEYSASCAAEISIALGSPKSSSHNELVTRS